MPRPALSSRSRGWADAPRRRARAAPQPMAPRLAQRARPVPAGLRRRPRSGAPPGFRGQLRSGLPQAFGAGFSRRFLHALGHRFGRRLRYAFGLRRVRIGRFRRVAADHAHLLQAGDVGHLVGAGDAVPGESMMTANTMAGSSTVKSSRAMRPSTRRPRPASAWRGTAQAAPGCRSGRRCWRCARAVSPGARFPAAAVPIPASASPRSLHKPRRATRA